MGEVADLRSLREGALKAMDTPVAFESFFEDDKDRLLWILAVIGDDLFPKQYLSATRSSSSRRRRRLAPGSRGSAVGVTRR
jgi:hypothetical protein